MQKIKTYFTQEKQNLNPKKEDFEMLLSKLEIRKKSAPGVVRSPFMFWSFASVSVFAAFVIALVNVVNPTGNTTQKLAVNTTTSDAINTIDSVKSFNIQNDPNF